MQIVSTLRFAKKDLGRGPRSLQHLGASLHRRIATSPHRHIAVSCALPSALLAFDHGSTDSELRIKKALYNIMEKPRPEHIAQE